MRTTVVIEDDLLKQLRDYAHRAGVSLKEALNSALRRGVENKNTSGRRKAYRCPSFAMGKPVVGVDLDKALRLADALADDETARKLHMRK